MKAKTLLFLAAMFSSCAAQPEAKTWTAPNGTPVLYRYSAPEKTETGKTYPLVLFLHGAGERGNDNISQLKNSTADLLSNAEKLGEPTYFIAPQCPEERWWSAPQGNRLQLADAAGKNDLLDAVLALVEETAKTQPVDRSRIYITGLSMGAYGTFDMLARSPETWAAAIPVCGAGDPTTVEKFKHVPIRIFHGSDDDAVPVQGSKTMAEALEKAGADVELTIYPGVKHDSWTQTYRNPEVIKWLFAQKK